MVDLSPALEAFAARVVSRMCPQAGTQRGQANALMRIDVPSVPAVPSLNALGFVPDADDVLERAAFLEFCEGLDRPSADRQALKEFGFENWDALAPVGGPAIPSGSVLSQYCATANSTSN